VTDDPYYGLGSAQAYVNALQGWADYLNEQEWAHTMVQLRNMPLIQYVMESPRMAGKTWAAAVIEEQERDAVRLNDNLLDALYRNGFRVTWEGWVTDH
jgi:hypothetical protein